jgi:putative tRNA adenosine deaminase-associated protein
MSEQLDDQLDGIDFAVAAFHVSGDWRVEEITDPFLTDLEQMAAGLRRFSADGDALGLVAIDEDFLLILRVGSGSLRVLLSDVTAADEWHLARDVVEHLGLPLPEDDDEQVPAGDLDIVSDLGMQAQELALLLDDFDLYPDEILSDVARRAGFGPLFDDVVGFSPA